MKNTINSIVARFPRLELELYRRCNTDERFRAVCSDYEEAAAALRRWQGVHGQGALRIAEYQSFLGELEAEILTELKRSSPHDAIAASPFAPPQGASGQHNPHPWRDA